jgi:hypothetical protein
MLDVLDRAEEARGGRAYWASHYTKFGLSSDFLHDPVMGVGVFAVDEQAGMMHVRRPGRPARLALGRLLRERRTRLELATLSLGS